MNYIFKKDNEKLFIRLWQEYVDNNQLSFEYSLEVLNYYLSYIDDLSSDRSFVIEQNGKCVGICFLPISLSVGYIIAPHASSDKIEKKIFSKIDTISEQLDIKQLKFYLSVFEDYKFNKLLSYNYTDTSISTCSVDLSREEDILWRGIRKSYKSLINGLIKSNDYNIVYSNDKNMKKLHNAYTSFHKEHMREAGKTEKDISVYNKQYALLESKLATIIAIEYDNSIIFTNYFFHNHQQVTYASSAYDLNDKFKKLPLNHYLLWEAILYFKKLDFKLFNFGTPCGFNKVNGFEDYLDTKQIDISTFKRGMGAKMQTQYQAIKFFDKTLWFEKVEEFKKRLDDE